MRYRISLMSLLALFLFAGCKKESTPQDEPMLRVKLRFDPTQARLNNLGQPSTIPAGHAAQSPDFRSMSVHYLEFSPNNLTPLGGGDILYRAPETTAGGANAIDFNQSVIAPEDSVFLEIPIKDIAPGTYQWVRASVAYQNYDIDFNIRGVPVLGDLLNQSGTIASFVGFNTYIQDYTIRNSDVAVNGNRLQGYWGFETNLTSPWDAYNTVQTGQAPAGATTVVNPLQSTSPIPAGSCVVTGAFTSPLTLTGSETNDITVTLSFSVNNSFEWTDGDGNGTFDIYYNGTTPDVVVDMGLRGMIPSWQ